MTTPPPPLDLGRLSEAIDAMTPAPWRVKDEGHKHSGAVEEDSAYGVEVVARTYCGASRGHGTENAAGIVALRNAAPALVAALRAAEARAEKAEAGQRETAESAMNLLSLINANGVDFAIFAAALAPFVQLMNDKEKAPNFVTAKTNFCRDGEVWSLTAQREGGETPSDKIARTEARVRELEAALAPFARLAEALDRDNEKHGRIPDAAGCSGATRPGSFEPTCGDLRAAARALGTRASTVLCTACGGDGHYKGPRLGDEPCRTCNGGGVLACAGAPRGGGA